MSPSRRVISALVVVALMVAACSGAERSDTTPPPAEATPTRVPEIVDAAVQKATLSIEDMEEGWSEYELSDDPETIIRIGGQFSLGDVAVRTRAASAFEEGRDQPFVLVGYISNTVVLAESVDAAKEGMNRLRTAAGTKEWQQETAKATESYKLSALAIDKVGDETYAVRLAVTERSKATGDDFNYVIDTVYYRVGPVMVSVFVQLDDTAAYARKSESKVIQLVSGSLN